MVRKFAEGTPSPKELRPAKFVCSSTGKELFFKIKYSPGRQLFLYDFDTHKTIGVLRENKIYHSSYAQGSVRKHLLEYGILTLYKYAFDNIYEYMSRSVLYRGELRPRERLHYGYITDHIEYCPSSEEEYDCAELFELTFTLPSVESSGYFTPTLLCIDTKYGVLLYYGGKCLGKFTKNSEFFEDIRLEIASLFSTVLTDSDFNAVIFRLLDAQQGGVSTREDTAIKLPKEEPEDKLSNIELYPIESWEALKKMKYEGETVYFLNVFDELEIFDVSLLENDAWLGRQYYAIKK